jgi:hypothetical protein
MSVIIQPIKFWLVFIKILLSFGINAQIVPNQYNLDSTSEYLYNDQEILRIIKTSENFILNIKNPNQKTLISEIPKSLFDFRIKRLDRLSKLQNKMYKDSLNYCSQNRDALVLIKCFFDGKKKIKFKYEAYNDGTDLYNWYDEKGNKIVTIFTHGLNYEESIFVAKKLIKKIVICNTEGYIQYFDLEGRVILTLDYIKGKIDQGTFIDHVNKDLINIVW